MLKSVVRTFYRHMSSSSSENIINSVKTVNSCRITFADPKTRYKISFIASKQYVDLLLFELKKILNDSMY